MSWVRLLCLIPLAYIVWWFYELLAWIIPVASEPIAGLANATWLQLILVILFFSLGIIALIIAFIAFFVILLSD